MGRTLHIHHRKVLGISDFCVIGESTAANPGGPCSCRRRASGRRSSGVFMDTLQAEVRWPVPCIYTIVDGVGFQTLALSGKAPRRTPEDRVRSGHGPPLVVPPGCSWIASRLKCDGPHPAYTPSQMTWDFRLLRYRGKHRGEPQRTVFVPATGLQNQDMD